MQLKEEQIILITRHFKGATSPEEESLIARWLEESDANKEVYSELKFLWNSGRNTIEAPNVDLAWKKVKLRANLGTEDTFKKGKIRSLYSVNNFIKIAASLIFIIGASIFILYSLQNEESVEIVTTNYSKEILLPDSSKVWINRNSKLSYIINNFNKKNRTVSIEGEAFFEVTKNPDKPFIVNGLLSRTEVLGTSFNVRSLRGAGSDEIQVLTGKVSFEARNKEASTIYLLPGDQASVRGNGKVEKSKTENYNSLAWKSKQLIFTNSSLGEVTEAAKNYFNIDIKITNPDLLDCKFTGSFSEPKEEEMMKILAVSMNFSYNKSDRTYVLTGEGCK